jgi:hypothetical protein
MEIGVDMQLFTHDVSKNVSHLQERDSSVV